MKLDIEELATLVTLLKNEINYTEENYEEDYDKEYLQTLKKVLTKARNELARK